MGDDINTHQKPGSSNNKEDANYAPAGLMLKSNDWKDVLKSDDVNKFFGRKEQPPQFTADGLKFSNQNDLNKYNEYKNALGSYSNAFTQTLRNEGGVFLGINSINVAYQKTLQIKRKGDEQASLSRERMNQNQPSNERNFYGDKYTPSGTRWQG